MLPLTTSLPPSTPLFAAAVERLRVASAHFVGKNETAELERGVAKRLVKLACGTLALPFPRAKDGEGVEVDREDEGFHWPTKPVGPVLDAGTVMSADWDIAETVHGPRRVVASPLPLRILELDVIRHLVDLRAVVFCGGGGGIPTSRIGEHQQGMPAVIDKDHFSSLLASDLKADALIISTEADAIYRSFGTPEANALRTLDVKGAEAMEEAGEFPKGSMGPKVKALCDYVAKSNDGKAVLCSPGHVLEALRGEQGTTITA